MSRNFSEILHSFFSLSAFLGVIGISTFIVTSLNPVAIEQPGLPQGPNIAGISTSQQPLKFINISKETESYKTLLNTSEIEMVYTATFNNLKSNYSDDFLRIQNTGENDGAFIIEALIPPELSEVVTIKIADPLDTIYLSNLQPRRISLEKNSERKFQITYSIKSPINYDFEIQFKIIN